jgi:hypothetical protein
MDANTFKKRIEGLIKIKEPGGYGFSIDANPKITAIQKEKTCEDCGQQVVGRTVQYFVKNLDSKRPYWLKNCGLCRAKEEIGEYRKK